MTGNSTDEDVKVVGISCGSSHSLALVKTANGDVAVSFGSNDEGQLGHGDAEERLKPQAIFSLMNRNISSVHCGAEYSIAVSHTNKELYAWGWADFGRLGLGHCTDVFIPTPIPVFSGISIAAVACGDTHTLFATTEGALYATGRSQNGQCGLGNINDTLVPQKIESLAGEHVVSVACGAEHSVCCTSTGKVYAFGWGRYGNLGDGETVDRHVPTAVKGIDDIVVKSVACGWRHSLAITDSGALYAWGWNKYGQLGTGDHTDCLMPKKVDALPTVSQVAGGWRHTLVADGDGQLYSFGWNAFGQGGLGMNDDMNSPTPVTSLKNEKVELLACGWRHSMVLTESGKLYTFGRGVRGQLGTGDTQDTNVPRLVEELSAGTINMEALTKEAHPVVMYSIPASDRYAVVPDNMPDGVPQAVPEPDLKKQKT